MQRAPMVAGLADGAQRTHSRGTIGRNALMAEMIEDYGIIGNHRTRGGRPARR